MEDAHATLGPARGVDRGGGSDGGDPDVGLKPVPFPFRGLLRRLRFCAPPLSLGRSADRPCFTLSAPPPTAASSTICTSPRGAWGSASPGSATSSASSDFALKSTFTDTGRCRPKAAWCAWIRSVIGILPSFARSMRTTCCPNRCASPRCSIEASASSASPRGRCATEGADRAGIVASELLLVCLAYHWTWRHPGRGRSCAISLLQQRLNACTFQCSGRKKTLGCKPEQSTIPYLTTKVAPLDRAPSNALANASTTG
mmetsp:Transcript_34929/g.115782  ORF Transcript_34929/g.115782 Transcript_34929/m.115782 type:complete len:257 (-) Transcript_34929:4183-4953(-)